MTPPIFTPDGTEVEDVILPDGSTAAEVIAPDGTVVFEGDVIPDSLTDNFDLWWRYNEASGSVVADHFDNSNADKDLESPSWVSDGDAFDGEYLFFDGADHVKSQNKLTANSQEYCAFVMFFHPTYDSGNSEFLLEADSETTLGEDRQNGWVVLTRNESVRLNHADGGSTVTGGRVEFSDVSGGEWLFAGATGDGDSMEIYLWSESEFLGSGSGSEPRGVTNDAGVMTGASIEDSNHLDEGGIATVGIGSTTVTQSDFAEIKDFIIP